ncbi:MAG: hypothetical protein ACKVWR_16225 [Acidimicrobiales bacterium]
MAKPAVSFPWRPTRSWIDSVFAAVWLAAVALTVVGAVAFFRSNADELPRVSVDAGAVHDAMDESTVVLRDAAERSPRLPLLIPVAIGAVTATSISVYLGGSSRRK